MQTHMYSSYRYKAVAQLTQLAQLAPGPDIIRTIKIKMVVLANSPIQNNYIVWVGRKCDEEEKKW
jgi:hypothetical protein